MPNIFTVGVLKARQRLPQNINHEFFRHCLSFEKVKESAILAIFDYDYGVELTLCVELVLQAEEVGVILYLLKEV